MIGQDSANYEATDKYTVVILGESLSKSPVMPNCGQVYTFGDAIATSSTRK